MSAVKRCSFCASFVTLLCKFNLCMLLVACLIRRLYQEAKMCRVRYMPIALIVEQCRISKPSPDEFLTDCLLALKTCNVNVM